MEHWAEDIETVMDAAEVERAVVVGAQDGGQVVQLFAATHPERTTALVLMNTSARITSAPGYPGGASPSGLGEALATVAEWWGGPSYFLLTAPSLAGDYELLKRLARQLRHQASPGTAAALLAMTAATDTRNVLPSIGVTALVIHSAKDPLVSVEQGRYLADHIVGARFVEVPGADHLWWAGEPDPLLDELEHFVTGVRRGADPDRVLATVLFTDIVASTHLAAELGDTNWRILLDSYDNVVLTELVRFRGRQVKTTGDGTLATFDGPARGIRCACAIRDATRGLGLDVRFGLHTGEVVERGADIGGIAVHTAARVQAFAQPGEILVSRTVVDLVAGSGIEFEDRGEQRLKGVPGSWRLFAVRT